MAWDGSFFDVTSSCHVYRIGSFFRKKRGVKTYRIHQKATGKGKGCAGSNNNLGFLCFPFGVILGRVAWHRFLIHLVCHFPSVSAIPCERSVKGCIVKGMNHVYCWTKTVKGKKISVSFAHSCISWIDFYRLFSRSEIPGSYKERGDSVFLLPFIWCWICIATTTKASMGLKNACAPKDIERWFFDQK